LLRLLALLATPTLLIAAVISAATAPNISVATVRAFTAVRAFIARLGHDKGCWAAVGGKFQQILGFYLSRIQLQFAS
jgi:hypothetical protein